MIDQENETLKRNNQRIKEDLEDLQRYVDELTVFLPLPFCTVNPLNLILGVNQSFQEMTGYKEMEVIGNSISDLFFEKKELREFEKQIPLKKERVSREATLVKKDQNKIPVSISALARTDDIGNFLGYFLTISDISESKKFQEKLEQKVKEKTNALENKTKDLADSQTAVLNILEDTEESRGKAEEEKNKTMAIISNFTDGILVFNKDDLIELVNPKFERIFGVDHQEVAGKGLKEFKNNEELKDLMEVLAKSPDFSREDNGEEREIFREEIKVDETITIEITTVPIFRDKGKVGTLAVLHDVTREKMVEAMKSEFVSIAAHQLRTPLSAIKWTMIMLLEGDLGDLSEEQKNLVQKAYDSNERMVSLINDLLNVSRIEEGRYLYKPSYISFNDIIDPLIEIYQSELKRRSIDFEIKIPKEKLPKVVVDTEKITLVIQNLLDNAMKYTDQGGKVFFSVDVKEKEIEVMVKDTGVGIPQDQQKRLFSKFFRAANVVRMETEGSGLGLFICKNVINSHKGRIWFESKEKQGSTFYFSLPIIENKKEFEEFVKKL
jgi:two-component system, OmpR family, phosphate regulon sensor histidine kinase PhoR